MAERARGVQRRGRRSGLAGSPLAAFVSAQTLRLNLSQAALAERLRIAPSTLSRLLHGKTRWSHVTPVALCAALELTEPDDTRLLALCAPAPSDAYGTRRSVAYPLADPLAEPHPLRQRSSRGRLPQAASSPAGQLIEPLLAERHMRRADLAHALGVKESTVTRLMNGAQVSSHAISAQGVSDALGLHGLARREFLRRALAMGAFALVANRAAPPMLRYAAFDMERFDDDLHAIQHTLDVGHAAEGLQSAHELYRSGISAAFPRTHRQMATRRIEAALLLGRAQEMALPWGLTRALPTAQTYNHIDAQILRAFAPADLAYYYARLYERRAPLYREMEDYAESIRQFSLAIDLFMPYVDDSALLAMLYRNRAHVWAVQGREREWRSDINSALRIASAAPAAMRLRLEQLVIYGEGEGYKRLAGRTPVGDVARQRMYARKAISSLNAARDGMGRDAESHIILLDVALAQAHLWLDPQESERLAALARSAALASYPALVSKCDIAIAQAQAWRRR